MAIGDKWKQHIYRDQLDGIKQIAAYFEQLPPKFKLYLRVHPNQSTTNTQMNDEIAELASDRVEIIRADDAVDSYALIDAVDNVLCFGSSIGAEATFWGKPSILLGPCFYKNFDCVFRPKNHKDAMQLATRPLFSCDPNGAIMYGYWLQTHGIAFKYFKADDLFEGKFKGQTVYARNSNKLAHRIFYKLQCISESTQRIVRGFRERLVKAA